MWILEPYFESCFTTFVFCDYSMLLLISPCQPSTPLPHLHHSLRENGCELSLKAWPESPFPTSVTWGIFLHKTGPILASPIDPPDNLLPPCLAWLNPSCQSAVLFFALHAPVRCRLVTGYLGFTHCRCACLFICSLFHGSRKLHLLPLILSVLSLPPTTLQLIPPSTHCPLPSCHICS